MFLLLAATAILYAPGLRGGFLLDDFYNLHLLERLPADGWASFVFSGPAGPGGRPLSMLSFALQHSSWPQAPFDFKFVNLLLHLLNGVLVMLIARRLVRGTVAAPAAAVALIAGGFWLLHPMQLSTVLYVVQRMAELSTLFMLLGLYGWLCGRELCVARPRAGYAVMTMSILAGTALATLAKENGILLPLLVLIADWTLLRDRVGPPGYARWRFFVLVIPAALPILYLLWKLPGASGAFSAMSYSMWQKTITEGVVLVLYLVRLLVPAPGAFGIYHDDFPVSGGLLDPPVTLAAVVVVIGLVAAAIASRRRWPVASFGLLWFFACHLLESTHLNLSLYFEHRNYLASFGIFVMLATLIVQFAARGAPRRAAWIGAGIAYAVLVAGVTAQNSFLWGNDLSRAAEGVRTHPDSIWARTDLGNLYLAQGRTADAVQAFRDLEALHPANPYGRLKQMAIAGCVQNTAMGEEWWRQTMALAPAARGGGSEVLGELDRVIWVLRAGECSGVDTARLSAWIEVLARSDAYRRERGGMFELAASLRLHRGEWEAAIADLTAAARASPTSNRRLQLVELLVAAGRFDQARTVLGQLQATLQRRPFERLGYAERIEVLRRQLASGRYQD